jgi:hypothetical protein
LCAAKQGAEQYGNRQLGHLYFFKDPQTPHEAIWSKKNSAVNRVEASDKFY